MALLKAAAAIPGSDATQDADIALLATDLGRLPLALSHAGAYIQQLRITVRAYRQEYADSLLDSQATMPTGDLYQQAVASTWSITIAAVEAKAAAAGIPPSGRLLLTAAAYLDPDGIPRSLLHRWLRAALQRKAASSALASSSSLLQRLLALLHSFSLISFTAADNPSIRMHRVLGTVLRYQHQQQQQSAPEDSGSVFVPFDLSWCRTMVETVIEEYEQSAKLPALRDVEAAVSDAEPEAGARPSRQRLRLAGLHRQSTAAQLGGICAAVSAARLRQGEGGAGGCAGHLRGSVWAAITCEWRRC